MDLNIRPDAQKIEVFKQVEDYANSLGLTIADTDITRPWGGSIYIDNASTDNFLKLFFPEVEAKSLYEYGDMLSPKFMIIEPGAKFSWQYHNRRAEIWKVVRGPVGIMVSQTDTKPETHQLSETGTLSQHGIHVRHRLIGLGDWGIVAEIWQHTDPSNPSDEEDIVRLEDDYGRS